MHGVFLVYLSLRPWSYEIWAYSGNTANFLWPISSLYLIYTLFVFMPHHFYPLKWSLFLFGRYLDKGSLHQLWVHSTFTDDAFKLTRLKNKLKLLKNKLPSAYRVFFFYLEKINKGDKIKLILTFPRFEFFLKDDVTKYSGCSEVIFKNSRLPLFYPRIFCLKFNNLTSKTRMFQWYLTIQLTLSKGDVTRNDSQRRVLAQHGVAMLEQCCNHSKQCRNNDATLCCAKNRRCESSRVLNITLRLHEVSVLEKCPSFREWN